jgi:hypothetical protein
MRILISYEDSYHLYSDALERAFSALLSSIHRSARKWNSANFARIAPTKAPGVSLPGALKDIRFSLPHLTLPTTSRNLLS